MADELTGPSLENFFFYGAGYRRSGCSRTGRNRFPFRSRPGELAICPPSPDRRIDAVEPARPIGDANLYRDMLLALLPPGQVWPTDADTVLGAVLKAIAAAGLAPVDQRAADLRNETDPRSVVEMLRRWENWLGLPDPCDPLSASGLEARRAAVRARETAQAIRTRHDLKQFLETLGYGAEIEEVFPLGTGASRAGCGRTGGSWHGIIIRVLCLSGLGTPRTGRGVAGDMRAGDCLPRPLDCLLRGILPAHVTAAVIYG